MLGGVYATAEVGVWAMSRGGERGRPQFDSEGLAVRAWAWAIEAGVEQLTAWPQQEQAATIPLDCKVY